MSSDKSNNEYWASKPVDEIAHEVTDQFDTYINYIQTTSYLDKIRTSYRKYYNLDDGGGYKVSKSQDGSTVNVTANHFKNLLKRLHILITEAKISFQPKARNSDSKSMIEADLAKGVLDYYSEEKGLDGIFSAAAETALVCMEAFVHCPWDLHKGEELAADVDDQGEQTGKTITTGDQSYEVLTAVDVARNTRSTDSDYYIVRTRKNKWDLVALHPEFKDEILASGKAEDAQYRLRPIEADFDTDLVDVYFFYHRSTPALPTGRHTMVCNDQVLADGILGYKHPPIFRLSAGDVIDTIYGDSPASDLLPIQEVINALTSAVVTNNMNFAKQNIWSADPNMSVKRISEGQNLIVSSIKPEPLQLTQSSAETYKLIDSMAATQQLLSGINSTARGNPETSLKSGNSLALMLSQAIQFVSVLQKNYSKLAGDIGTCTINNIQHFAKGEMVVNIGGQKRKSYVKSFQSQDIMNIDRISVELSNPLTQNVAGRYELVQQWMQFGLLKSPMAIVEFLKTGQSESLLEDQFADMQLVREENEELNRGIPQAVLVTDMHSYHISEHKELLNDPDSRRDPQLIQNVLSHIQEHINVMKTMDPDLAAALAGQPLPSMQMMQGPPQPMPGTAEGPLAMGEGEAALPNVPPGTPPEIAANYAEGSGQSMQDVQPQ